MLRLSLKLDAVVTGANGLAYVVLAAPLGDVLKLSPALLRGAGAFLLVFAALVWLTGTRPAIARPAVLAIVAVNAIWALDSVVAALAGWGSPSTVGTVWLVAQALVVGAFGALQLAGQRRASGPARALASIA